MYFAASQLRSSAYVTVQVRGGFAMFKNISISAKIFGGFGFILLLLLFISTIASLNLVSGNESFSRYRSIARQTNQAGLIQAELLTMRISVKNFLLQPSTETVLKVKEDAGQARALALELDELVNSPEKKQVARQAVEDLQQYLVAFDNVTQLQGQRNDIVRNSMDTAGAEMERKLSEIAQSAFENNDVVAAYHAGVVQRSMLLMRLRGCLKKRWVISTGYGSFGFARFDGVQNGLERNHPSVLCPADGTLCKRHDRSGMGTG
ncbi:hypothetical protein [Pannonibacter sp. SL95]|uniref:hypothetical protein n=1 Tax=Pannonibacter sp. SL95 TaxID=2995153 RepID=UPI002272BC85|nr:hypothetical protein [Pannonibacter sp. SL95]MCY1707545.1 hypothetical protein [Pannonibacter sp. SL95]